MALKDKLPKLSFSSKDKSYSKSGMDNYQREKTPDKVNANSKLSVNQTGNSLNNQFKFGTLIDDFVVPVEQKNLPVSVAYTFKDGNYSTVKSIEPITVYRKFGGGKDQAKLLGGYATTIENAGRNETAVYPKWSTARFEAVIEIPKGEVLNIGKVGSQPVFSLNPKYRGGADQILLPQNYPYSWIKSVKDGKTGIIYSPSEFKQKFNDQISK